MQSAVKKFAPEQKYIDVNTDMNNINDATGAVVHVTAIGQGDTMSTRHGDSITVNSLNLRGQFTRNSTTIATPFNTQYRVFVFIDKQQVGDTVPTMADVIINPSSPVGALPNLTTLDRFKILFISPLYDGWRMGITPNVGSLAEQRLDFYFDWQGSWKVNYNGTASTDIQKNGFYVGITSSDANDTIDAVAVTRIGFIDA